MQETTTVDLSGTATNLVGSARYVPDTDQVLMNNRAANLTRISSHTQSFWRRVLSTVSIHTGRSQITTNELTAPQGPENAHSDPVLKRNINRDGSRPFSQPLRSVRERNTVPNELYSHLKSRLGYAPAPGETSPQPKLQSQYKTAEQDTFMLTHSVLDGGMPPPAPNASQQEKVDFLLQQLDTFGTQNPALGELVLLGGRSSNRMQGGVFLDTYGSLLFRYNQCWDLDFRRNDVRNVFTREYVTLSPQKSRFTSAHTLNVMTSVSLLRVITRRNPPQTTPGSVPDWNAFRASHELQLPNTVGFLHPICIATSCRVSFIKHYTSVLGCLFNKTRDHQVLIPNNVLFALQGKRWYRWRNTEPQGWSTPSSSSSAETRSRASSTCTLTTRTMPASSSTSSSRRCSPSRYCILVFCFSFLP